MFSEKRLDPVPTKSTNCSMSSQTPTLPVHNTWDGILGAPHHPRGGSTSLRSSLSTVGPFSPEDAKQFYPGCLAVPLRRTSGDKVRGAFPCPRHVGCVGVSYPLLLSCHSDCLRLVFTPPRAEGEQTSHRKARWWCEKSLSDVTCVIKVPR